MRSAEAVLEAEELQELLRRLELEEERRRRATRRWERFVFKVALGRAAKEAREAWKMVWRGGEEEGREGKARLQELRRRWRWGWSLVEGVACLEVLWLRGSGRWQ